MAFIPIDRVVSTLIQFLEEQRPVFDTLVNLYHSDKKINIFQGYRDNVPISSLPAIEVYAASSAPSWFACRVQQEEDSIILQVVVNNGNPSEGSVLESRLSNLVSSILASPPHLRPMIQGTQAWLFDSLPGTTTYSTSGQGKMRVSTMQWSGKYLVYLENFLFDWMKINSGIEFPYF